MYKTIQYLLLISWRYQKYQSYRKKNNPIFEPVNITDVHIIINVMVCLSYFFCIIKINIIIKNLISWESTDLWHHQTFLNKPTMKHVVVICISYTAYDNAAMARKVKGYTLLGAALQTAEKEKQRRNKKWTNRAEHTNVKPVKVNP